jgi:EmrB/QacA subfamily drug resistance transporter
VAGSGKRVRLASATGRAVVAAAVLGSALAFMSDDMLNVAIPSVAAELGGSVTDIQWIVNSYYVALVSLVLVAGSLGDILGHRRVFLTGLSVFAIGALVCSAAPGLWLLIVGRGLQGVGAAATLTAGLALVIRLIRPDDRSRAIGAFLAATAALPAVGPILSGVLLDLLSWRAIFLLPLVFPIAGMVLTRVFVPETVLVSGRRLDIRGTGSAFATLAALMVALIVGPGDWAAPLPVTAMAVAAVAASLFVILERRAVDPMLPLRLFRARVFLGGNVAWLLACMASSGAVFFIAISLQTTVGYSPLLAGLVLTPIYLVMMVGSPLAARWADRIGPTRPTVIGLALFSVGLWMLSRIGPESTLLADVLPGLLVMAGGMTTFATPLASATLGAVGDSDQGVASGINNMTGQLAGLLAIAVLPALAGLGGAGFGGPEFARGHTTALMIAAGLAAGACIIVALTFRPWRAPALGYPRGRCAWRADGPVALKVPPTGGSGRGLAVPLEASLRSRSCAVRARGARASCVPPSQARIAVLEEHRNRVSGQPDSPTDCGERHPPEVGAHHPVEYGKSADNGDLHRHVDVELPESVDASSDRRRLLFVH